MFKLNKGAISWKSSKQCNMAIPNIDDEDIAKNNDAFKDAVWFKNFLSDLGVFPISPI